MAITKIIKLTRRRAIKVYRNKYLELKELLSTVKTALADLKDSKIEFKKTEEDLDYLQYCGLHVGEVLRPLDSDRYLVKKCDGDRYVVACRSELMGKLTAGTRVGLEPMSLTVVCMLPREVNVPVHRMLSEDPGNVSYSDVGGLTEQMRELRECVELPFMNPELFERVGIKPPKGVLLYGPPGTGKTLMARAIASNVDAYFMKVVASSILNKYAGESARTVRGMFEFARRHQPCIIFMDEIDAIGGRRLTSGTCSDREIQRTLMELLNQLDGFDQLGQVKMIMATNRPDTLDPALLRPGRLDRKIEIPLPGQNSRIEIIKIHASEMTTHGEIDYEAVVKLAEGFNAADIRNICTEAGMIAICDERDFVLHEDFMNGVRKVTEAKKIELAAQNNVHFGKE